MSVFEAPSTEAARPGEAEQWPGEAEQWFAPGATQEAQVGDMEGAGTELESPFRSAATFGETEGTSYSEVPMTLTTLESPFQSSFAEVSESETSAEAFRELLAELESEQFDEAIAQLVDEAAGLHLASGTSWSSAEAAPSLAMSELEAWIEPLRQEADRMLDNMAERLGNEELETLRESELETLFESLRPDTGFLPGSVRELPRRAVPQGEVARLGCRQARQEGSRRSVEPGQAGRLRGRPAAVATGQVPARQAQGARRNATSRRSPKGHRIAPRLGTADRAAARGPPAWRGRGRGDRWS